MSGKKKDKKEEKKDGRTLRLFNKIQPKKKIENLDE
jgi:hypothetical protein